MGGRGKVVDGTKKRKDNTRAEEIEEEKRELRRLKIKRLKQLTGEEDD